MAISNSIDLNPELLAAAAESKAWPFEEAKKIVERYKGRDFPETVLFETGYGPSGLPHIGTFGEVARTTMVRHAFHVLTEDKVPTRLICFSDDMDGMRKIPDNVPDRAALEPYLHMPLTVVPNPFGGDYESFGHHNNAMLRRFLDTFGFDYEFASATDYYKSGRFDEVLLRAAEKYDAIISEPSNPWISGVSNLFTVDFFRLCHDRLSPREGPLRMSSRPGNRSGSS